MDPLAAWYNAVGPGWRKILETLSGQLASEGVTPMDIAQVKEKFGGLRVYLWNETDKIGEYLSAAEEAAENTCERCGSTLEVVTEATWPEERRGWIKTLCPACWAKRRESMQKYES